MSACYSAAARILKLKFTEWSVKCRVMFTPVRVCAVRINRQRIWTLVIPFQVMLSSDVSIADLSLHAELPSNKSMDYDVTHSPLLFARLAGVGAPPHSHRNTLSGLNPVSSG